MSDVKVVSSSVINVTVTSSASSFASEKRFAKDLTVAALKVNHTCDMSVLPFVVDCTWCIHVKLKQTF